MAPAVRVKWGQTQPPQPWGARPERGLTPVYSRIAWKLNRLRCMSPSEVGYRVMQAATMRAERWGLAPVNVPAPDLTRRAQPWIDARAPVDAAPYVEAAERVISGRHDVFALDDVELGNPPQWNRDPKTGVEAPLDFGKQLDYRDSARVGDCKYLWEANRHLHLVTLAQAYALTSDARYSHTLRSHLESWFEACPFRKGANWSSSLEAGMRLINWALAWQLLGGVDAGVFRGESGRAFRERWLRSVYQHAEFIAGHFSLHSSANNHLIGEAAGLYAAGVAWPHWARSLNWRNRAHAILEREALLQNAPDGVNREQAVSYQQFTFDLLLFSWLAGRANGDPFASEYSQRLEKMLEFLASIMDVGGNLPMFGDADDAHVARLDPRPDFCRYRSSLATGAALFHRNAFRMKAGALDDKTRWLLGADGVRGFGKADEAEPLPVRQAFAEGGYYILGMAFETLEEIRLVADAGPLGYREIAAHGHADALSFTLSVGGVEMLVDPGTFAYHTDARWRAYFRGTSAHNTVRVDGLDQSVQGGNFMWLRKAGAKVSEWTCEKQRDVLEACHDGYLRLADPVIHRRRIALDKRFRRISLEDTLEMNGVHDVEIFLHCAEGTEVVEEGGGFKLSRHGKTLTLTAPIGMQAKVLVGSTEPLGGWISRRFDRKGPAPTLVFSGRISGTSVLRTSLDCSG